MLVLKGLKLVLHGEVMVIMNKCRSESEGMKFRVK